MEREEWNRLTYKIFSELEKEWFEDSSSRGRTRVLSIDGGGLKALISGQALVYLEQAIQTKTSDPKARIADFFDVIAGTGMGGIFASMLLADDGRGRPLYTAKEAVELMIQNSHRMFKKKIFRRRFSGKSFDEALREILSRDGRALTLKDMLKPLLIPCYDLESGAPFLFSRADAVESDSFDFQLWSVCRATTATPGLFKPVSLSSFDGKTLCTAVDGGLVMNNPTAAAVTHVMNNRREFPMVRRVEDLLVLSLGNATFRGQCSYGEMQQWSGRDCSTDAVQVAIDGISDTVDQMLNNAFCGARQNYVRIQATALPSDLEPKINRSMTDNVKVMIQAGEQMLKEKCMEIEPFPFGGKKLAPQTNLLRLDTFINKIIDTGKQLT
ncbi:probable inactive patatin-like protein 9 [Magnolia sinica]|uniref:probable inactive patatin-like protein 9 n=1 Tax=Magnolia sinica TaxID=86752 RepID=UPI002658F1ED|nr:probable inactive patatin-like protein 9 [Magnolia sinica]